MWKKGIYFMPTLMFKEGKHSLQSNWRHATIARWQAGDTSYSKFPATATLLKEAIPINENGPEDS